MASVLHSLATVYHYSFISLPFFFQELLTSLVKALDGKYYCKLSPQSHSLLKNVEAEDAEVQLVVMLS